MATHAMFSSHALSSHIVDDVTPAARTVAPSLTVPSSQPSLLSRMYDAFTAGQMRRAMREVDRILGSGSFRRALRGEFPPER